MLEYAVFFYDRDILHRDNWYNGTQCPLVPRAVLPCMSKITLLTVKEYNRLVYVHFSRSLHKAG